MKTIRFFGVFLILYFLVAPDSFGRTETESLTEIKEIFKATKVLCESDNGLLWGRSLDVPILFIDEENETIYSNFSIPKLELTKLNDIYWGKLPDSIDAVKGPLKIGSQICAVIPLPLPEDATERECLILHESFHCLQPSLDLEPKPYNNNHMDEMEARFWLKLEWKALELALQNEGENRKQAITDALCFRNYRRALFSKCDGCENRFEIHEGMAEYTAQKICRKDSDFKSYLEKELGKLWESPSFVNCFAYYSGPVYAYLLDQSETDWRTLLSAKADIALMVQNAYEISLPIDIFMEAEERSVLYRGAQIMGEELDREVAL